MITDLKIKNFRSLKDVELKGLQPVNLLIGPNNSGKSNILRALKFFGEFMSDKMPSKEQLEPLFYKVLLDNVLIENAPISFQFLTELNNTSTLIGYGGISVSHHTSKSDTPSFAIVGSMSKEKPKKLPIEDVESLNKLFDDFLAFYFDYSGIVPPLSVSMSTSSNRGYYGVKYKKHKGGISSEHNTHDIPLSYFYKDGYDKIFSHLNSIKIYRPEPSKLLQPYPIQNEQTVNEDASNLVAFLDTMNRRNQNVFKKIINDLKRFITEFEYINFELIDTPQQELQEKYPNRSLAKIGLTDSHSRMFWADSLSEGTLYFLSLLCIIHQPEPPKLLLLEEPEKGIHPRRIRETMDLIFELAEEKGIQVILTTHSTAVVDTFADIPEAVYIVEREVQETTVKNLQRDVIEPHNEQFIAAGEEPIRFTEALGEHWAMGFLGGVPNDNY